MYCRLTHRSLLVYTDKKFKKKPVRIDFANVSRFEDVTIQGTKGSDKELFCLLFETDSECAMPRKRQLNSPEL